MINKKYNLFLHKRDHKIDDAAFILNESDHFLDKHFFNLALKINRICTQNTIKKQIEYEEDVEIFN